MCSQATFGNFPAHAEPSHCYRFRVDPGCCATRRAPRFGVVGCRGRLATSGGGVSEANRSGCEGGSDFAGFCRPLFGGFALSVLRGMAEVWIGNTSRSMLKSRIPAAHSLGSSPFTGAFYRPASAKPPYKPSSPEGFDRPFLGRENLVEASCRLQAIRATEPHCCGFIALLCTIR